MREINKAQALSMPPSSDEPGPSNVSGVPTIFGFCGAGFAAVGFGAGFGASSYRRSAAFKELVEKFPDPPTAEAEQLARSGATRALAAGTALAGLMGVGAVVIARSQGIMTAQDLADAIKTWLPTREGLEVILQFLQFHVPRARSLLTLLAVLPAGLRGS